jgi:hypothetical protein
VTRLVNHLLQRKEDPSENELDNLQNFILLKFLPNDLRLSMARELTRSNRAGLVKLYAIPEIGKLLLNKM